MNIEKVIKQTKKADLAFFSNGIINISAHVSRAIGLNVGDTINIARVDCGVPEYYLYVERRASETIGRHRGTCRPTHGNGHNMRVYNCQLARYVIDLCHADDVVRLCTGEAVCMPQLGMCVSIIVASPPAPLLRGFWDD